MIRSILITYDQLCYKLINILYLTIKRYFGVHEKQATVGSQVVLNKMNTGINCVSRFYNAFFEFEKCPAEKIERREGRYSRTIYISKYTIHSIYFHKIKYSKLETFRIFKVGLEIMLYLRHTCSGLNMRL